MITLKRSTFMALLLMGQAAASLALGSETPEDRTRARIAQAVQHIPGDLRVALPYARPDAPGRLGEASNTLRSQWRNWELTAGLIAERLPEFQGDLETLAARVEILVAQVEAAVSRVLEAALDQADLRNADLTGATLGPGDGSGSMEE